jgi:hypothetical protein
MPSGIYERVEHHKRILSMTARKTYERGRIPWNKDTKDVMRANSGSFQKGCIPWNKKLTAKEDDRIASGERAGGYGRKRTIFERKVIGEANRKRIGEKHPLWQGGISFEPYSPEFNYGLKLKVRQRDNSTCQFCGAKENGRAFPSHHINYDKKDCDKKNLILLCNSCNVKANSNRKKWEFFFQTLMEIRQC